MAVVYSVDLIIKKKQLFMIRTNEKTEKIVMPRDLKRVSHRDSHYIISFTTFQHTTTYLVHNRKRSHKYLNGILHLSADFFFKSA